MRRVASVTAAHVPWRRPVSLSAFSATPHLLARGKTSSIGHSRPAGAERNGSLFDLQLKNCLDCAAVLRAASTSQLPLTPADVESFFRRLRSLDDRMPKSGSDLHGFVEKIQACLTKLGTCTSSKLDPSSSLASSSTAAPVAAPSTRKVLHAAVPDHTAAGKGVDVALFAVANFADLRCRQGAIASWPFVARHINGLKPERLVDSIWAISAVPNPSPELVLEVAGVASKLAPRLRELPHVLHLYRAVYGLARVSRGRGSGDFRRCAERAIVQHLGQAPASSLTPTQLVRFCWAFARLGCRPPASAALFAALERPLRGTLRDLTDRELEALYGILTDCELVDQWRLIHAVENQLEARQDSRDLEQSGPKEARKHSFRKKWTRANLSDSVLPPKVGKRRFPEERLWRRRR